LKVVGAQIHALLPRVRRVAISENCRGLSDNDPGVRERLQHSVGELPITATNVKNHERL
jgi:hypothetical protein